MKIIGENWLQVEDGRIKALKARIVEIMDGREKWKAKAMNAQAENAILKKSMEVIKKKLHQIDLL